jgi:hypothetical protein
MNTKLRASPIVPRRPPPSININNINNINTDDISSVSTTAAATEALGGGGGSARRRPLMIKTSGIATTPDNHSHNMSKIKAGQPRFSPLNSVSTPTRKLPSSTVTITSTTTATAYWKKLIVSWSPAAALLGVYLFSVLLLVLRPQPTSWTHLVLIENPDEGRPPPWTMGVSTFPNPNASHWGMPHLPSTTTLVTRQSHLHLWNQFLSRQLSQEQQQQQGQGNNDTSTIISSDFPETSSSCSFSSSANQSSLDCRNTTNNGISNTTNKNYSNHSIATIVVQLRGEMANHLSAIAHGRAIQLYALESFGIETQLVFVPQELQLEQQPPPPRQDDPTTYTTIASSLGNSNTVLLPKGMDARETLHQCFPILQSWNTRFMARDVGEYGANVYDTRHHRLSHGSLIYPELFHQRQAQQLEWLQQVVGGSSMSLSSSSLNISSTNLSPSNWTPTRIIKVLDRINGRTNSPRGWIKPILSQDLKQPVQELDMEASLTLFQHLWRLRHDRPQNNTTATTNTTIMTTTAETNAISSTRSLSSSATATRPIPLVSLPFLYSDSLDNFWLIDRYYDEFRRIFSFWSNTPTTTDPYDDEPHLVNNPCCREIPHPDESVFVSSFCCWLILRICVLQRVRQVDFAKTKIKVGSSDLQRVGMGTGTSLC